MVPLRGNPRGRYPQSWSTLRNAYRVRSDTVRDFLPQILQHSRTTVNTALSGMGGEIFTPDLDPEYDSQFDTGAYDIIFGYLHEVDNGQPQSRALERELNNLWRNHTREITMQIPQAFGHDDFHTTIDDLGRLLSYEVWGHNEYIYDQVANFFDRNCDVMVDLDDGAFLAILSAICEMCGGSTTELWRPLRRIKSSPGALSAIEQYLNGVRSGTCPLDVDLSNELLLALNMQPVPGRLPPQQHRALRQALPYRARRALMASPMPQPGFSPGPALPFQRLGHRLSNSMMIRGSQLPRSALQQIALARPDAVKVDTRLLMSQWQATMAASASSWPPTMMLQ